MLSPLKSGLPATCFHNYCHYDYYYHYFVVVQPPLEQLLRQLQVQQPEQLQQQQEQLQQQQQRHQQQHKDTALCWRKICNAKVQVLQRKRLRCSGSSRQHSRVASVQARRPGCRRRWPAWSNNNSTALPEATMSTAAAAKTTAAIVVTMACLMKRSSVRQPENSDEDLTYCLTIVKYCFDPLQTASGFDHLRPTRLRK